MKISIKTGHNNEDVGLSYEGIILPWVYSQEEMQLKLSIETCRDNEDIPGEEINYDSWIHNNRC